MSIYSDRILAESSLLSYWKLNEAAGATSLTDSKGGITGTVVGTFTLGARGLIATHADTGGKGVGDPSRFTAGDNYPFTGTSAYSIEAWISPDAAALSANAYIFDNGNSSAGEGWNMRLLAAGSLRISRALAGAFDSPESTTGIFTANGVYHIVGTYDGTNIRGYVNSQLILGPSASSKALTDPAYTLTMAGAQGGGNVLTGYVDEVAIYNSALSDSAIRDHWNYGASVIRSPQLDYDYAR